MKLVLRTILISTLLLLQLSFSHAAAGAQLSCSDVHTNANANNKPKPWNKQISFRATTSELTDGKIVSMQDMRQFLSGSDKSPAGTTGAILITYENGLRGVWKPNIWESGFAEVGAFQALYNIMGRRDIPPTVMRDIGPELKTFSDSLPKETLEKLKTSLGSIQYFVKGGPDLTNPDQRKEYWPKVSDKDKSDRDVFYFVFGQSDRHWGNVILDDSNSIVLIDNSPIKTPQKVQFGSLPFLKKIGFQKSAWQTNWPEQFPFEQTITLTNPSYEALKELLVGRISQEAFDRNWDTTWKKRTDRSMSIIFWQNAVWIQGRGLQSFKPIKPTMYSERTLHDYAKLNFQNLRDTLPPEKFSNDWIFDVLTRRDMILRAAESAKIIP